MFKVNNKDKRTVSALSVWCLYCQLSTYFSTCSSVSIVDFEQPNEVTKTVVQWENGSLITFKMKNEKTIKSEAIVRSGPMSSGYSTSIDAENDFTLNSHILVKLRKEFKNKMNFKTDSNFKKSTPSEIRKHEDQIATLIGNLNNYSNPFHEVAWNTTTGAEIPGNIINGLLSARKYATERVEQFTKKRLLSREVNFYDPIQRITSNVIEKKETER